MQTRGENKVDPNGGTKRQVIHHERRKATWDACGKKKGCWYGYGCFRVPAQISVLGCPAMRVLRNLKERTKAALLCLVSMTWIQPTVPSYSSSSCSTTPKPSKQPSASSDSHRNQAVEDCISYINSSTTSCSLSSSIVSARSPLPKSCVPETPQRSIAEISAIAAVTIPPPPPPPPRHFSTISTTQNKSTAGTPSGLVI